jgi:hypothetical protein
MSELTYYKYADGSGNTYVITRDKLEYIPVKPKESSSFQYSGGNPALAILSESQFDNLAQLLETLLKKTDVHTENRVMMSGLIIRHTGMDQQQAILRPGCREILIIETEFNKLLTRK